MGVRKGHMREQMSGDIGIVAIGSPAGRRHAAFTLIEIVIAVAIIATLVVLGAMRFERWRQGEAVKSAARSVQGAFSYARSEARRTGNNQLVLFQTDISGNDLLDDSGNKVPILVLNDGRPGSANQNCVIDAGEPIHVVRMERGVSWGANTAGSKVGIDEGTGPHTSGSTFVDSAGNDATWVLFLPNGTPRAVDAACTAGPLGSGAGGIYLKSAVRDAAVVLTPLGATRVVIWGGGMWN
ncbi:MAG: Tfp pilus assembly protein FimT/FimU [Myxococcota bacterium]